MRRLPLTAAALALGACVASALHAQQALQPGAHVRGTLGPGDATLSSGEYMDVYALAGRAGQRLVVRMTSTAFDSYLLIRGPADFHEDNDDEATGSRDARLDVRLPADGTYRVIATSYRPGESGAYELDVQQAGTAAPAGVVAAAGGGPLAPGQTGRGTLAAGDDTLRSGEYADTWRLAGRSGQRLTVRLESSDFDPYLMVRGPGGFSQDNDDDPTERGSRHSRLDLTLPADGEYRLLATSYRPGETGAYTVTVSEAGVATVSTGLAPSGRASVAPGQTLGGRLGPGDAQLRSGEYVDAYPLAGTRGQRLEIRLVSTEFDPYVIIRGPGGFSAFNDDDVNGGTNNSRLVVTLPADGQYEVDATSYRPGETGSYQLSLAATSTVSAGAGAAVAAQSLAPGQPARGTLAPGDDTLQSGEYVDRFSFTARRGQRLSISMASRAFDTYVILVAPSGRQEENDDAAQGITDSRIETELAEDGAYTVLATSYRRGEAGDYELVVGPIGERTVVAQAASAPASGPLLVAGSPRTGRLESGDQTLPSGEFADRFSFRGRRGQTVTLEMASTEFDSYLIVQAPDATQQENDDASGSTRNARLTWVLPVDGSYTVVATSYRPGETGAYSVRLSQGAVAAPAVAVAARPAGRPGQRVWAVMVGISDYGGRANNLPYTAEDAQKLAQTLRRSGMLADGSVVLTDAEATYDAVRAAFQRVAQQAGPDDVFLFFYSGHGTQLPENPRSGEPDLRDEAIVLRDRLVTDDEMAEWFRGVHARIGILALDACFSGGFARDVITHPGVMGLFSSEEDLTSAVADKFQAGGYLSHFLRTGLSGDADQNHDGNITAGELSAYLRREFAEQAANVEAETSERQRNYQFLVVERGGVKIDDVVLALGS